MKIHDVTLFVLHNNCRIKFFYVTHFVLYNNCKIFMYTLQLFKQIKSLIILLWIIKGWCFHCCRLVNRLVHSALLIHHPDVWSPGTSVYNKNMGQLRKKCNTTHEGTKQPNTLGSACNEFGYIEHPLTSSNMMQRKLHVVSRCSF